MFYKIIKAIFLIEYINMIKNFKIPLVNTHAHAAMIFFRWMAEDLPLKQWLEQYIWPMEAKYVNAKFVYEQTRLALKEMKKNWIRVLSDMYFFEDEVAQACEDEKIYAFIGECLLDFPTPNAKTPQEWLIYTQKLFEKYKNSEYVQICVAPHSIYATSTEILVEAKKLAKDYNSVYHIHLSETKNEFDECMEKHNKTPVKYMYDLWLLDSNTLLAHCVRLTDEDIDILSETKANISHCPLSNLKLGSGILSLKKLMQKWVNICLWTDGAASSNRLDIRESGKFCALMQKWVNLDSSFLTVKQIVEMMSVNGMKALGLNSVDGKTIVDIQKIIDNEESFNYFYELNIWDLIFD